MNTIYKNAGPIMLTAMVVVFAAVVLWYGTTEVAFKVQDDTLYRQIKNGRVGADCYDQDGTKVIAPSRVVGPEWVKVASLKDVPESGKTFSTTCFPYDVVGASDEPISSSIRLAGLR